MKKGFGSIHYCTHFLDRVLSKSARSSNDGVAAFHIASHLLKELDALQEQNPLAFSRRLSETLSGSSKASLVKGRRHSLFVVPTSLTV